MTARSSRFELQAGALTEFVDPGRGKPYVHRCPVSVFERVCHAIDEVETFTLEGLVATGVARSSQTAVALRFLREWGLVEHGYPRCNRKTEASIHLSAMACLHGMSNVVWAHKEAK